MDDDCTPALSVTNSMCPRCGGSGTTRLLLITVPHFRDLLVSSFECDDAAGCGERNRSVQCAGRVAARRVEYRLAVATAADLNRQVVKGEFATLAIPEVALTLPRETQAGALTTVEGVLARAHDGLMQLQPLRFARDPAAAAQIDVFCAKLDALRAGATPFTVVLDDPAGNSYIEALAPPAGGGDPRLVRREVARTAAEQALLGLATTDEGCAAGVERRATLPTAPTAPRNVAGETTAGDGAEADARRDDGDAGDTGGAADTTTPGRRRDTLRSEAEEAALDDVSHVGTDEVLGVPTGCEACGAPGVLRAKVCDIPGFRETVLLAFRCDACGFKSNEVKSGGAVPAKGRRLSLTVATPDDLTRDVLKSASCTVAIPEIELELGPGTLGAFFTTVEGLVTQVHEALAALPQVSFEVGDSAVLREAETAGGSDGGGMAAFLRRLAALVGPAGMPWTLVLDDPLALVHVEPRPPPAAVAAAADAGTADPQLAAVDYVRTAAQDEALGLADLLGGDACVCPP